MLSTIVRTLVTPAALTTLLGVLSYNAYFATMATPKGVDFHKLCTDTKVKTLPEGTEIKAKELWNEHGAVVMVVRRPG